MAATVCPDTEGPWTFEVQSWSDPIGTWLHDAGIKIRAGVDVELMFAEGVLLLERVLASHDHRGKLDASRAGRCLGRDQGARRHHPPGPGPPGRGRVRGPGAGLRRPPAARPAQHRGALPLLRRPRTRAVLQLVRVLPPLGGCLRRREDRQGRQRHAPHRRRTAPRRRGHGLRRDLPAADPPDRRGEPQGLEQHARPRRPTTSAHPGRSAARTAGTTPSTPTSARSPTSTPSWSRPARWAWRWRSTSRSRPRRTTRGRPSTRSGSPPAPTAPSRTPRTRRRSTRTSTRSTSTTTPTGSTRRPSG